MRALTLSTPISLSFSRTALISCHIEETLHSLIII